MPSAIDEYVFMCRWDRDGAGNTVTSRMLEDRFGPPNVSEKAWAVRSTDAGNPDVRVLLTAGGVEYHPSAGRELASYYVYSNLPVSLG